MLAWGQTALFRAFSRRYTRSPRGWQLAVSDDGTAWRTLAAGAGTGQLTNVDVPPTRVRYLRITSTATSGNWWSVADVRLYR